MRARIVRWSVILGLVAVLLPGLWRAGMAPAPDLAPVGANAHPTTVRPAASPDSPDQDAPEPPAPSLPSSRFELLAQRARTGDVDASRELYEVVRACHWLQHSESVVRQLAAEAAHAKLAAAEREHARRQLDIATRMQCHARTRCTGLESSQLADPLQWLQLAAMQGDLDAQVGFVAGTFIHGGDLSSLEHLADYQRLAPAMLEQALAAGHPAAYVHAARALAMPDQSSQQHLLAELLPSDPLRARSYFLALVRASGDPEYPAAIELIDELFDLSPEQKLDSELAAERVYLEFFSKIADLDRSLRDFGQRMSDPSAMPVNAKLLAESDGCR